MWIIRGLSSHPQFCELLYLWGCDSSGKDTLVRLIQGLFGEGPDRLSHSEAGSWLTSKNTGGREGHTSRLMAFKGSRFSIISEMPDEEIQTDDIKRLTEHQGALVAGRKAYATEPEAWRPMGIFVVTSNFPAKCKNDDGMARRLKPVGTKFRFRAQPEQVNDRPARPGLSKEIAQGDYSSELFFALRGAFALLARCRGSELEPVPAQVREELDELFARSSSEATATWLEASTLPVSRSDASPGKELAEAAAVGLGVQVRIARQLLLRAGAVEVVNGRRQRVYAWAHPAAGECTAAPGLKLKA